MEYAIPEGRSVVVTDDGTELTFRLIQRLQSRGWPVAVLRFPAELTWPGSVIPDAVPLVAMQDLSEESLQKSLMELSQIVGRPAVFIHLHPTCRECQDGDIHFTESAKQVLQTIFLAAKHLKEDLNQAAALGKGVFMTAVRLDGEFGLGANSDYDPISGGLFGLVKSLNLEWESVFCRAVDLNPEIDPETGADLLMEELLDPNRRIVEVAYGPMGRMTLGLEPEKA
jgi:hypothetical protein